jgi:hypothetical protein
MFRAEDIRARLRQQPFRPFRLLASEVLRYDINHPELVLVGQRDVAIGLPSTENPAIYDQLIRVAMVHVVGLEDLPAPASGAKGPAWGP